jgi:hypothetical protein
MSKPKNHNGMYINLERLKKFAPKDHPIPRDKYTFHIQFIKAKQFCKSFSGGLLAGGVIIGCAWLLSLIKLGKPPALPGDSQSLTVPGI